MRGLVITTAAIVNNSRVNREANVGAGRRGTLGIR